MGLYVFVLDWTHKEQHERTLEFPLKIKGYVSLNDLLLNDKLKNSVYCRAVRHPTSCKRSAPRTNTLSHTPQKCTFSRKSSKITGKF